MERGGCGQFKILYQLMPEEKNKKKLSKGKLNFQAEIWIFPRKRLLQLLIWICEIKILHVLQTTSRHSRLEFLSWYCHCMNDRTSGPYLGLDQATLYGGYHLNFIFWRLQFWYLAQPVLKMEAICSSEIQVCSYKTILHYNPENHIPNFHHHENLKFRILTGFFCFS